MQEQVGGQAAEKQRRTKTMQQKIGNGLVLGERERGEQVEGQAAKKQRRAKTTTKNFFNLFGDIN